MTKLLSVCVRESDRQCCWLSSQGSRGKSQEVSYTFSVNQKTKRPLGIGFPTTGEATSNKILFRPQQIIYNKISVTINYIELKGDAALYRMHIPIFLLLPNLTRLQLVPPLHTPNSTPQYDAAHSHTHAPSSEQVRVCKVCHITHTHTHGTVWHIT